MNKRRADFLEWDVPINRRSFLLLGVILTGLKILIDLIVATKIFERPWSPRNYLFPGNAFWVAFVPGDDQVFFGTMLLVALPFLTMGLVLTRRRLVDVGLPSWLVLFFFVPLINLLFFAGLCVVPSGSKSEATDEVAEPIADDPGEWLHSTRMEKTDSSQIRPRAVSIFVPLLVSAFVGVALTYLGTQILRDYGWGLFLGIPFVIGLTATLLERDPAPIRLVRSVTAAQLALLLYGFLLLTVAIEGLVCLIMAWPIAAVCAAAGATLGWTLMQVPEVSRSNFKSLILVTAILPGLMGAEQVFRQSPTLFAVRTSVEVNAPPEQVWRRVVAFDTIPPPTDWVLRSGIAYPTHAEIERRGVGAIRRCVFTTGAFVEPIQVWDEPRLLKFSVTSQPAPMREWSPWTEIKAPHLDNFLISRGGQFLLIPLPGGKTRLEGTTWYQHGMSPEPYWRIFSDSIIHRIHLHVLEHVKSLAEAKFPG